MWSSAEYAYHLVTSLPQLKILDQQEVTGEVRANATKWKQSQGGNSTSKQMTLFKNCYNLPNIM